MTKGIHGPSLSPKYGNIYCYDFENLMEVLSRINRPMHDKIVQQALRFPRKNPRRLRRYLRKYITVHYNVIVPEYLEFHVLNERIVPDFIKLHEIK